MISYIRSVFTGAFVNYSSPMTSQAAETVSKHIIIIIIHIPFMLDHTYMRDKKRWR